jgi:CIC family chloride channel protein
MLVPSMLACTVAYFISTRSYIYENQMPSRAESPAHKAELSVPLLKRVKVADFMKTRVITTRPDATLQAVVQLMREKKIDGVPVMDGGKLAGFLASRDIALVPEESWSGILVGDIMARKLIVGYDYESLHNALRKMTENHISHLPIVQSGNADKLTGIITIKDIIVPYDHYKEDIED